MEEQRIDAYNLLHDYIKLKREISEDPKEKYDSLPWDDQIRVQRVFSLIISYLDQANNATENYDEEPGEKIPDKYRNLDNDQRLRFVLDFFAFRKYGIPPISKSEIDEVQTMIKDVVVNPRNYRSAIASSRELKDIEARIIQLKMLLKARLKSAEFRDIYSGYLGGIYCVLPYTMVNELYFGHLVEADEKLDKLIVLLLGSVFQKSLSKEELVKKYGYPKETDDELFDYYIDNL